VSDRAALAASVTIAVDTEGDRYVVKGSIPVYAVEMLPATATAEEVAAAGERIRDALVTAATRMEMRWP
jgi:hypothetical protein